MGTRRNTELGMADIKKRTAVLGFFAVICFSVSAFAQFSGWQYYQSVTLSVTGVTAAETNYPLLVKLTSSNSSVWANCNSSGTDIQFSDPTGVTAYPFQRAYWNYGTSTAEFWVLVPAVNSSPTATTFRMYYGNPGATDASSGSAVFQTSNNYQAVWHLTSAVGTSDTDATGSGHNLVPSATAPGAVTNAPVGVGIAKAFDGATNYYTANNSGGASSSLIMPTGGPFTMSCWYNPLATLPTGKQVMGKICTNGITTWTGSYGMVFNGSTAGDLRFNDIVGTASERCHYQLTASTWYHLVWTRIDTGSTAANTNVYVNGALAGATATNGTTNARVDSLSWCIGRDCALGTSSTVEYCPGQIAEVQVSNVVRDPGWAAISYQTQLSTSTAVSFGSQTANAIAWPNPPVLATPVNNALNQPLTENFSWVTVTGTATYELQVSGPGDNTFSTTTYDNATLTGTSQTVSGLSYATTYYWRVQGQNSGNSPASTGWSTVNSFTTAVDLRRGYPDPLFADNRIDKSAASRFVADVGDGVRSGYLRHPGGDEFGFRCGRHRFQLLRHGEPGISVVPTGLAYSTTCYWEVNATNPGGTTAWSGVWSFSTAIPPPGAPVLVSPENGFSTIPLWPNLTWNSVAGATTYELQTAVTTGFSTTVVDQPGIAGTSLGIGPLSYGTVYYWEVRAVNGTGPGAWSAVRSFTSAEDYNDNWSHHLAIPLNTTGVGGANVKNMVTNFPVLVRLTTSNFPGFSQVQSGGKDIRFSGPAPYTKSFPYQIDYWSGTAPNDTAAIWVLMDTIVPGSTSQTLYLHYGNATAPADTSGAQVFDTANGFAGVWHLGTGATQADATINNRPGTADGKSIDTMGIIGRAKKFTVANNDSIMIGSLMGSPSVVTMSCWAKVDSTDAAGPGTDLMSIGDNADMRVTKQYSSGRDSVSGIYKTGSGAWNLITQPSTGTTLSHNWVFYTYVCNPLAAKPAESLYVNGVKVAGAAATNPIYYSNSHTLFGKNGSGSTSFNLGGVLDEPRIDKVARSTDWINLCFQNQQINQTLLVQTTPAAPILSLPTNNAANQSASLTLSWGTVLQATGYSIQVSASTSFNSPVFSQSGLTSPIAVAAGLSTGTTYYWQASASNALGAGTWSTVWSFTTVIGSPGLSLPANGAIGQPVTLSLSWSSVTGATTYSFQVSTSSLFGSTVFGQSGLTTLYSTVGSLVMNVTYYWEANATSATATGAWSAAWSFTTAATQTIPLLSSWNMASLNVVPQNAVASAVFGTVPGGFLFVKDNAGDVYCPTLSENDIGNVQVGQGYQVYSSVPDTIRPQGVPVNFAVTPISLTAGWNLIGYLPQADDSIVHAFAALDTQLVIVKNDSGFVYWPALAVDNINALHVGQAYKILMSDTATFFYPAPLSGVAKRVAGRAGKPMLRLPAPKHYAVHAITGNNATLLAKQVVFGDKPAPDSCEIGAYDASGNMVGSGTVAHGIAVFAIWGKDPQTAKKDGCLASEAITFRLWNGKQEYALDYVTKNRTTAQYAADKVLLGELRVPEGSLITKFDLTRAYPNPFSGSVKIAFDVPTIAGVSQHTIEINVYDLKGSLVKQLAKGPYQAGHYELAWNCGESREASVGSSVYVVRMKANGFDKRIKLVRVQ